MDIRKQLLEEHSKENSLKIVNYINDDEGRFETLFSLFLSDEYRVSQRAAMVLSACFDKNPYWFNKHLPTLIQNLDMNNLHVAVKRNTVRILQFVEIPEDQQVALFDHCINYLADAKEPIAVKAFSMQILYNICKEHPQLKTEVIPLLEDVLERNESAGIQSRGRKILKKLYQL
jgi:hypothetical protein